MAVILWFADKQWKSLSSVDWACKLNHFCLFLYKRLFPYASSLMHLNNSLLDLSSEVWRSVNILLNIGIYRIHLICVLSWWHKRHPNLTVTSLPLVLFVCIYFLYLFLGFCIVTWLQLDLIMCRQVKRWLSTKRMQTDSSSIHSCRRPASIHETISTCHGATVHG